MPALLIRSRAMVTHAIDRHHWDEIADGAVLQEDGTIVEIGTYRELSRKHPNVAVVGSGNEVLLPGFVNGHHHIGLTPVQLGSPDMPLELWLVTRLVMRNVNLYLDTPYSAFEMIASGVTTAPSTCQVGPAGCRRLAVGSEILLPTGAIDFRPDLECLGPGSSMLGGSDVVAAKVEEVVDLIVG
jgi:5-methylthioadenosine/S-adenosylhomocysteine deaminase